MKIAEALKGLPRPEFDRLMKVFNGLPADEIYTTKELTEKLNCSMVNFHKSMQRFYKEFEAHTVKQGGRRLWGSKKAVEAYKKGMGIQ